MTQAGDLRDRITIYRQANTKNLQTGGLTRGWGNPITLWAEVRSINGREVVIGNVLQGISTFQIRIRYRDDVSANMQIRWRGRELNILAAEDSIGTREWLTIHASTEAPQGAGAIG